MSDTQAQIAACEGLLELLRKRQKIAERIAASEAGLAGMRRELAAVDEELAEAQMGPQARKLKPKKGGARAAVREETLDWLRREGTTTAPSLARGLGLTVSTATTRLRSVLKHHPDQVEMVSRGVYRMIRGMEGPVDAPAADPVATPEVKREEEPDLETRVRDALRRHGPQTTEDLVEATGLRRGQVKDVLAALPVERKSMGRDLLYSLPPGA